MSTELTPEVKAIIEDAKQKYGRVFKTSFNGGTDVFYIRQLSRIEYKQLANNLESVQDGRQKADLHDEHVAQNAVVYPKVTPEFLSKSGAGFVTILANEALRVSGFTNDVETSEV